MSPFRSFAIVPAAGLSTRMGRPKLLLPWKGATIIDYVLEAWTSSGVSPVVVVVRKRDGDLAAACRRHASVEVVSPDTDPEDMKASVQCGLRYIAQEHSPLESDVWLTAPADLPRLTDRTIQQVLAAYDPAQPTLVVPQVDQRRGHPVLFPWSLHGRVFELGPKDGVNRLLDDCPTRYVAVENPGCLDDIDNPADYDQLKASD